MPVPPSPTPESILAKLPVGVRIPLDKLRSAERAFSRPQVAFIQLYGKHFTVAELGIVFGRRMYGIATLCSRLGVKLLPAEPIRKAPPPQPRAPLSAGARHMLAQINSTGIGSSSRPRRANVANDMPESLRNYRPEKADYDAGWFVSMWILQKMGLRRMGPEGCSWIEGDPCVAGWTYCGKPRVRGGGHVYCEHHIARVYSKPKQETEDGGSDQEANGGARAGVDDKARVQQDDGGTQRRTRGGGRSGDERRERLQKVQKAGHQSRGFAVGPKAQRARK